MRMVDADAIIIDLLDRGIEGVQTDDYAEFCQIVEDAPTVDAVPVVRCAICHFYEDAEYDGCTKSVCRLFGRQMQDDDYCSYGECKGADE